ncbi:MAG TPA: UMP kinase [Candidatus Peribacterales bacterium]|nr:UMP kinase [Candidatus Peribacterales bacterium]
MTAYKRIMLKLSGEALSGKGDFGLEKDALHRIAEEVVAVTKEGIEVTVTVGGGNIWRFRDQKESGIERTASDAMGMLATIMNAVALQAAIEALGAESRVCSAIDVPQLAEPYLRRRAVRHIQKGRIVICAGGTGNPYFTTDSAAALRALELNCDIIMKATNVDGVYDKDPKVHKDAKRYDELTLQEAIEKGLGVMDQAALSLCREQGMGVLVFDFTTSGNLFRAVKGEKVGTKVTTM